jgi:hypothetical protein
MKALSQRNLSSLTKSWYPANMTLEPVKFDAPIIASFLTQVEQTA